MMCQMASPALNARFVVPLKDPAGVLAALLSKRAGEPFALTLPRKVRLVPAVGATPNA